MFQDFLSKYKKKEDKAKTWEKEYSATKEMLDELCSYEKDIAGHITKLEREDADLRVENGQLIATLGTRGVGCIMM